MDTTVNSLLQGHDCHSNPETPPKPSSRQSTPTKPDPDAADAAPEALPQQADGFDWAEKGLSLGELTDGMAALSIKPEGAGYFGM